MSQLFMWIIFQFRQTVYWSLEPTQANRTLPDKDRSGTKMICSNSTRCINPQRSFRGYYHLLSIVHKDACSFRKLDLFTLESLLLQLQKTGPFKLGQPTISLSSVDYIYSKASGICRLARFDRILHPHIRNRTNLPPWADQSNTADDYMFLYAVQLS